MSKEAHQPNLHDLRKRAEHLLSKGCERHQIEPLLQCIVQHAADGSELSAFAHRNLAELFLEEHPWKAALHLRRTVSINPRDDIAQALLGLCQTLLGNYGAAVSAYRKALQVSPHNPWYHHNLGHLLDVALSSSGEALHHLRKAHEYAPQEHEITASLAHCLAGLGKLEEAQSLAERALQESPNHRDHKELHSWIIEGAPVPQDVQYSGPRPKHGLSARSKHSATASTPDKRKPLAAQTARRVLDVLEHEMQEAGFPEEMVQSAVVLWNDYKRIKSLRVKKPEAYAAAVEYAIYLVHGVGGMTRAAIAKRYGVTSTTVGSHFNDIRDRLDLQPGDPRYAFGI